MSILVQSISKNYQTQKALDQVTFQVKSGEIVGFLGPNGAGKSTMMKILTGYISADSGSAEICGIDVNEAGESMKTKIGYLPEHNPLYLDLYVKEYLQFISGVHQIKNPTNRIAEIIQLTGLSKEAHKKIGALSKGYRQRVGLAQAMIHDPEVLILDEPTTGLDPNQIVEIRQLIKTIGSTKTVLFSTHIMQEVQAICSRAIIVNKGKIVADSTIENLNKNANQTIIEVEFDNVFQQAWFQSIAGFEKAKSIGKNKWEVQSKLDIRSEIFKLSVEKGISVLTIQLKEKNLEQIFQNLTQS
jgi:ABC-2 type transport system ATP-binding protein